MEHDVAVAREPEKRTYSTLHHLEVHKVKGKHGGFKVLHHREGGDGMYQAPQEHLFGKDEGHEMIAHVAQHMGVPMEEEPEPDENIGPEDEA